MELTAISMKRQLFDCVAAGMLASAHEYGMGTEVDLVKALEMWQRCAQTGNQEGIAGLAALVNQHSAGVASLDMGLLQERRMSLVAPEWLGKSIPQVNSLSSVTCF